MTLSPMQKVVLAREAYKQCRTKAEAEAFFIVKGAKRGKQLQSLLETWALHRVWNSLSSTL